MTARKSLDALKCPRAAVTESCWRRLALLMRDRRAGASDSQAAESLSGESRNWRW